jgi:2,5-diketo-D-gluconate reductase A
LFEEPVLKELAEKYGKSIGQIVLNWHVNRGYSVIPKTETEGRLSENLNCYDFSMEQEEYNSISKMDRGARFFYALNNTKIFN